MSTGFGAITSLSFLPNYSEPTLALLHHPRGRTTPSHAASRKAPTSVTAISLSVSQRRSDVIWRCSLLPNDSFHLSPVPLPLGGLLVTAPNSLHHLTAGGTVSSSLAVNGYAHSSVCGPELLRRRAVNPGFGLTSVPEQDTTGEEIGRDKGGSGLFLERR